MKFKTTFSKCLLVFALFCFKNEMINAQSKFKIGLKAGLNVARIVVQNQDPVKIRYSYHLGVTSDLAISSRLSLQPDLLFSSQGYNLKLDNFLSSVIPIKMNYLILNSPVAFKTKFVHFRLGPYVGYLLSASGDWADYNGNQLDVLSNFNRVDMGLTCGVNFLIKKFFVGINGSMGLISVTKPLLNSAGTVVNKYSDFNQVAQASVGYYF
jgi:Outer membrane protein beta-barrel domain